jgi:quercetin dioxygenase-like cupin family protein
VLRAKYGAHEKSVMHSHPACFAIFLTASRAKFTFLDGKNEERSFKAGDTMSMPAETHLPENLTDSSLEVILVEFK